MPDPDLTRGLPDGCMTKWEKPLTSPRWKKLLADKSLGGGQNQKDHANVAKTKEEKKEKPKGSKENHKKDGNPKRGESKKDSIKQDKGERRPRKGERLAASLLLPLRPQLRRRISRKDPERGPLKLRGRRMRKRKCLACTSPLTAARKTSVTTRMRRISYTKGLSLRD